MYLSVKFQGVYTYNVTVLKIHVFLKKLKNKTKYPPMHDVT